MHYYRLSQSEGLEASSAVQRLNLFPLSRRKQPVKCARRRGSAPGGFGRRAPRGSAAESAASFSRSSSEASRVSMTGNDPQSWASSDGGESASGSLSKAPMFLYKSPNIKKIRTL